MSTSNNNAANYLLRLVPSTATPRGFLAEYALTEGDVAALKTASILDAQGFVYNGCASFLAGLSSFNNKGSVWTVAKMYYTVFYLARAALCRNNFRAITECR